MKITILTLFPEFFTSFLTTSIIKRAIDSNKVEVEIINFRDYTNDRHLHVDDTPYGGGQGMLLSCQPIVDCLKKMKTKDSITLMLTPEGTTFTQTKAIEFSNIKHLILLCGHYEGFDDRISYYVDQKISLGDFILTGGEPVAQVIADAVIRLLDGVILADSHQDDSFETGLLEYPQYTKPAVFEGLAVPEVLLSGHHENIRKWRLKESLKRTSQERPDLLEKRIFSKEEQKMMEDIEKGSDYDDKQ